MKKKSVLSGVVFIGFGLYFLSQQYNIHPFKDFHTWPTLLLIVGIGFIAQGYSRKDYDNILPGVVLTGIGIHFHVINHLAVWPDHAGIFLLVIALGLLLKYVKTGIGLLQGILFLAAAILLLFFDRLANWAALQGRDIAMFSNFWPIIFIVLGAYFLFSRNK